MSFPVSLHNWCSSASLCFPLKNRPFVMAAAGCGLGDGWVLGLVQLVDTADLGKPIKN